VTGRKRSAGRHLPWEKLGAREREILEVLFTLREATVAEVREALANPPSYSAVRGMLALLEQKEYVKHRRDGLRYVYSAAVNTSAARGTAVRRLLDTFFGGSPERAVAALLDLPDQTADELTLDELRAAIVAAKRKER
jgi:BlaI family penicillinase repressor